MAIPPFPSQEVAKLVLGYLAEEDLMTAYDEFLQASPYLDAFSNEYGRVFMTSLKNILAEYMAIKIYVESCKPIALRRKLMQCSNLLEVVKLLIAFVDVQKASFQDKPRVYKPNVSKSHTSCDLCGSTDYISCLCNSAHTHTKSHTSCEAEIESSVEATSLADLPGNAVVKDDVQKEVSIGSLKRSELDSSEPCVAQRTKEDVASNSDLHLNSVTSSTQENATMCRPHSDLLIQSNTDASRQNLEEFNSILNKVTKESNSTTAIPSSTILSTDTFSLNPTDSIEGTLEAKDSTYTSQYVEPATELKLQEDNLDPPMADLAEDVIPASSSEYISQDPSLLSVAEDKSCEQKIKILSDIKVNNDTYAKMPPIMKSNTPLVQMQTLYINGTCAYKNNLKTGTNYNYTKDEIMAMPTIILVPSSGPSSNPQIVTPKATEMVKVIHSETASDVSPKMPLTVKKRRVKTNTRLKTLTPLDPVIQDLDSPTISTSTDSIQNCETKIPKVPTLRPLSIDVKSHSIVADKVTKELLDTVDNTNNVGLVKTVDSISASLPKEPLGTTLHKTSTPNAAPPMKKSSSTPRRTSHIRVLDFTTPRRILNENSIENTNEQTNPPQTIPLTQVPHCNISSKYVPDQDSTKKNVDVKLNSAIKIPVNKLAKPKRKNWDADLRAQLAQSDVKIIQKFEQIHDKSKSKENKEKKVDSQSDAKKSKTTKRKSKDTLSLNKAKKVKEKPMETTAQIIKEKSPQSISSQNVVKASTEKVASDCSTDKTPKQDDKTIPTEVPPQIDTDTPEAERQALQNAIGVKLNISELLETPYKQALYDIQMETPRFLGPDIPDEPMSDIKIMNIPTPRFFDTPKITQATPSSYSSRQTDYSSGGSYYKPDDQDYIPISEVLECAITVCAEDSQEKPSNKENDPEVLVERPRRPVRNCTKNVSYRRSSVKPKDETLAKENPMEGDKKQSKKAAPKTKATPGRKSKSEAPSTVLKDKKESPVKIDAQKKKSVSKKSPVKEIAAKRNRKLSIDSKPSVTDNQTKKKVTKDKTNASVIPTAAPTKSRRKSATPRKLHCTKSFNSDSSELLNKSTEDLAKKRDEIVKELKALAQDSDSEQPPLRWSDDGSQEAKSKERSFEDDDIDNIKKYIENCKTDDATNVNTCKVETKRNFDAETARIIERDLLDTPPRVPQLQVIDISTQKEVETTKQDITVIAKSNEKDDSNKDVESDDEEEIELSVCHCDEESDNYFTYVHNETSFVRNDNLSKLKEKFCMELCIEDDISIRLNATAVCTAFEEDPEEIVDESYVRETVSAVCSISNMEKLYTPMKSVRKQYIDIFDSTLTSLDTPLKKDDTDKDDTQVTEIVLEIESVHGKDRTDGKKRKRSMGATEMDAKKPKSDTQELIKSTNIQDIDIESVLSKLHGP